MFEQVAPTDWSFDPRLEAPRRARLCRPPAFEAIIDAIGQHRDTATVKWRKMYKESLWRIVITYTLPEDLVDLFHSSVAGYRAQYYLSEELGERANRYAVDVLSVGVNLNALRRFGHSNDTASAVRSLSSSWAKVWIYQGMWCRHAAYHGRRFVTQRWPATPDDFVDRHRKLVRYAGLVPTENRLEVKGAWLTDSGTVVPHEKTTRAAELHRFGFT